MYTTLSFHIMARPREGDCDVGCDGVQVVCVLLVWVVLLHGPPRSKYGICRCVKVREAVLSLVVWQDDPFSCLPRSTHSRSLSLVSVYGEEQRDNSSGNVSVLGTWRVYHCHWGLQVQPKQPKVPPRCQCLPMCLLPSHSWLDVVVTTPYHPVPSHHSYCNYTSRYL